MGKSSAPIELADRAAATQQASWEQTHERWGRGWLELHEGFMVSCSEVPVANFNGAAVYSEFDPHELRDALARVRATGCPYSVQCRPAVTEAVDTLAGELGLDPQGGSPMMACTEPPTIPIASGLTITELPASQSFEHASVLAQSFGAPMELSIELTPPEILEPANVWTLVGYCDAEAVTTAYLDLHDRAGQLHNVGTLPAYRGRGFGAAISAVATNIAFDCGADMVMLQSSAMGVGVYESIGFSEIEYWPSWASE